MFIELLIIRFARLRWSRLFFILICYLEEEEITLREQLI